MNIIDEAKALVDRKEIQEASSNFLEDAISSILGDPISIAKMMLGIIKSPFFIREQIFWMKFSKFLSGVFTSENDRANFSKILTENGTQKDNSIRLLACIERAETETKIQYIINASRSLLSGFITLNEFFRICRQITHNLDEDLRFLQENLTKSNISYNYSIEGLLSTGLMYQSIIDANEGHEGQNYSFTTLAEIVDRFAVSYDDVGRYPNPKEPLAKSEIRNIDVVGVRARFS